MSQNGCVTVIQRASTRNKPARDPTQRTKDSKQEFSLPQLRVRRIQITGRYQELTAADCRMKCRPTLSGQKPISLVKITLDIGSPKPRVDQPVESPSASYCLL